MKQFILEVPAGTEVEIREYDNCHTITLYEKPQPILVHDLLIPEECKEDTAVLQDKECDLVPEE